MAETLDEIVERVALVLMTRRAGPPSARVSSVMWQQYLGDARLALTALAPNYALVSLGAAFDAYDEQTKALPLGAEDRTRGASVYNWRTRVSAELRAVLSASDALASLREGG